MLAITLISILLCIFRDSDYIRDICRVSDIGLVPHVEDGLIPNKVGEYLAYGLFIFYTPKGPLDLLLPSNIGARLRRDFSNLHTELTRMSQIDHQEVIATARQIYLSQFYYLNYYRSSLPSF